MMRKSRLRSWATAVTLLFFTCVLLGVSPIVFGADEPVSVGKPYFYATKQPRDSYPDPDGTKLTDGNVAAEDVYWNPEWTSVWSAAPFVILIDLQEAANITRIRSHHLAGTAGIKWPTAISVQVSEDSVKWSEPVDLVIEDETPGEGTSRWFTLDDLQLKGRWVQVTYTPTSAGSHVFMSEIEVY